jgi:hypothetical protein
MDLVLPVSIRLENNICDRFPRAKTATILQHNVNLREGQSFDHFLSGNCDHARDGGRMVCKRISCLSGKIRATEGSGGCFVVGKERKEEASQLQIKNLVLNATQNGRRLYNCERGAQARGLGRTQNTSGPSLKKHYTHSKILELPEIVLSSSSASSLPCWRLVVRVLCG